MKNIFISILSIFFIFACSSTPVEKVDVQETKTVDLTATKQQDTDNEVVMNNVDVGEAYVTILFDYDEDTLKEESLEELFAISRLMKSDSMYTLLVEGHADERGTREYNLALSERRAKAVEDFLTATGVSSFNIEVVGYGEEVPVDTSSNESAWSKNRRAELFFIK
ncbi:MAG: OmpA family protein [Gammaproteobacteria bacterium]|jgi:peptidoglycan-associated lipoprotein|uniref:Peptidoglycan-associated lipoprotein n=1 Tax=SAR86 cluster bacterium TaxID=2030880 RepID=A0A520MTC8_9GAMM|nr:MAG: peptidoglycan-associated lipoprotein [SAR86 cluster bacterium]|tara:strand:- start:946 stop:1443 length:498 start_codon:yes stop_codon:yes gene_type:complete